MCTQFRQMDEEGHTIAGKSKVDFHHYLFSFRVLVATAVAQEQLVSFLLIDSIQLALKKTYFILLEQKQSSA